MAIIYVFSVNNPNNVSILPPSVEGSAWISNLDNWLSENNICKDINGGFIAKFDNEDTLNSFLSTHKCVDSALLADINLWKSAHGVSYSSQYFTLTDANISSTPIIS